MSRIALASPGSMQGFGISRQTFNNIERFISDNKASVAKVNEGIDLLVRGMVMVTKGLAQQKSMGSVAPMGRSNPALAYRIPVQRITGRYFAGWTQRKVGNGHWVLSNGTVEAYLIETGLHMRTRRPILKMSLIGMLKFIQTTRTADRFLDWVLAPRRNSAGRFQSFQSRLGSGIKGTGMQYTTMHGGSRSAHNAFGQSRTPPSAHVARNATSGPHGRLP